MRNRGTQGIIGTPTASVFGATRRPLNHLAPKTLPFTKRTRYDVKTKFYDGISKTKTFESLVGFLRYDMLVTYEIFKELG
jgi:hypothetical protein